MKVILSSHPAPFATSCNSLLRPPPRLIRRFRQRHSGSFASSSSSSSLSSSSFSLWSSTTVSVAIRITLAAAIVGIWSARCGLAFAVVYDSSLFPKSASCGKYPFMRPTAAAAAATATATAAAFSATAISSRGGSVFGGNDVGSMLRTGRALASQCGRRCHWTANPLSHPLSFSSSSSSSSYPRAPVSPTWHGGDRNQRPVARAKARSKEYRARLVLMSKSTDNVDEKTNGVVPPETERSKTTKKNVARKALADYESKFFDYVTSSSKHPAAGSMTTTAKPTTVTTTTKTTPSAGGSRPMASYRYSYGKKIFGGDYDNARTRAISKPDPRREYELSVGKSRVRSSLRRSAMEEQSEKARRPATPKAGGEMQWTRPLPPPVSEFDYDYFDEEMGVSAAFGDVSEDLTDGVGADGRKGSFPASSSVIAGSKKENLPLGPHVFSKQGGYWDTIEGIEDPDYDPYFTVDADAPPIRLPETEREARWTVDDDEKEEREYSTQKTQSSSSSPSWSLSSNGDAASGSAPISENKHIARPKVNVEQKIYVAKEASSDRQVMAENEKAVSASAAHPFRSAEEFLARATLSPSSKTTMTTTNKTREFRPLPSAEAAVRNLVASDQRRPTTPFGSVSTSDDRIRVDTAENADVSDMRATAAVAEDEEEEEETSEVMPRASLFSEIEDVVGPAPSQPNVPRDAAETFVPEQPVEADERAASVPPRTFGDDFLAASSSGTGVTSTISVLSARLARIKESIVAANGGEEFNPGSPKQVAEVLYGKDGMDGQSTDKDTLEALASAGNIVADLVLKYRKCLWELRREEKRAKNVANGSHVSRMEDVHGRRREVDVPRSDPSYSHSYRRKPKRYSFDSKSLESDPLLLVDASAYVFRAYYSMPPLHRSDGTPVGAVLGFCNMIHRLVLNRTLSGLRPRLVLVFDAPGRTFRHELYPEYKANRRPCPVDLAPQFDLIREAADAYGIPKAEASGYEADDVIATLARMALEEGVDVNVLSGDKDLMQLVTPPDVIPGIHMIDPMNMVHITHGAVMDKWGVPPEKLGDVLALAGDSSDNIPGIPGIGPKIAAMLVDEFGSFEEVLSGASTIKQKGRREKIMENADKARLSRSLIELDRFVPLDDTVVSKFARVSDLRMDPVSAKKLLDFYDLMGFVDLKRRISARLSTDSVDGALESHAASKNGVHIENVESKVSSLTGLSTQDEGLDSAKRLTETATERNANDRAFSTKGIFTHRRKWTSPPKPEDYDDVPF